MEWIRESNLIEGVDSEREDRKCVRAYEDFMSNNSYLNLFAVVELHRRIMRGFLRQWWCGRLRTIDVTVGGRKCPEAAQVPRLLEEWIHSYREPATEIMIKEAHIAFEKIHPFVDGNGRVGRMVMNYQAYKAGLYPLLIKANYREDYYKWFD